MTDVNLLNTPISDLLLRYPYAKDFFTLLGLPS